MSFFRKMNAYTRCPRSRIEEEGGTLIDLKWIDTNKGGRARDSMQVRSRLVATEVRRKGTLGHFADIWNLESFTRVENLYPAKF